VLEHAVEDEGDGLQTAVRVPLEPGRGEPVFAKHQESAFLTPLVVLLIDLLAPAGWRLAEDGLIDTLIGGTIVLLIGFAPWPMSWYAHLPQRFAEAARGVSAYLLEALQTSAAPDRAGGAGCSQVIANWWCARSVRAAWRSPVRVVHCTSPWPLSRREIRRAA